MKIKIRVLLVVVLAAALCICVRMPVRLERETGSEASESGAGSKDGEVEIVDNFIWMDWEAATRDDGDIEIKYDLTDNGNNYYDIDVTLENMQDYKIDNWEIWIPVNYEIRDIRDAKVIDHYEGKYTIHSTESNQDIPVGGSVSFHMTATCSDKPEMPRFVYSFTERKEVREEDYKVEFRKNSRRKRQFTGRIIITNLGEERLEDWGIDLYSNFKITEIRGAVLVDEFGPDFEGDYTHQEIENPGSGQNIEPGKRVEFEFTGVCDGEPKISDTEMTEVTSDDNDEEDEDDEDDEDEDDSAFEDKFILDSDYFETREEYEKYLKKHGLTDDALIELE